jgi:hypothetical protein
MSQLLALGCSHTAGVGISAEDCYATVVAKKLNMNLVNLGLPGGNCHTVQQSLIDHLNEQTPDLIIAQWPNPFRLSSWSQQQQRLETVGHSGPIFQAMLLAGEENFLRPWVQTIVVSNMLCQAKSIRMLNILLESVDQSIHNRLAEFGIRLHQDDKQPGRTWYFDSAGSDGVHHSANCHRLWAERILDLL